MTTVNRTLRRETFSAIYSAGRQRPVIVEIEPPGRMIGFRLKATRPTYYLSVDHCYRLAVAAHVEAERRRKRQERKQSSSNK